MFVTSNIPSVFYNILYAISRSCTEKRFPISYRRFYAISNYVTRGHHVEMYIHIWTIGKIKRKGLFRMPVPHTIIYVGVSLKEGYKAWQMRTVMLEFKVPLAVTRLMLRCSQVCFKRDAVITDLYTNEIVAV